MKFVSVLVHVVACVACVRARGTPFSTLLNSNTFSGNVVDREGNLRGHLIEGMDVQRDPNDNSMTSLHVASIATEDQFQSATKFATEGSNDPTTPPDPIEGASATSSTSSEPYECDHTIFDEEAWTQQEDQHPASATRWHDALIGSVVDYWKKISVKAADYVDTVTDEAGNLVAKIWDVDTRAVAEFSQDADGQQYTLTAEEKEHLELAVQGMVLAYETGTELRVSQVPKGHTLIKHVEGVNLWRTGGKGSIKVSMNVDTGQCLIAVRGTDSLRDIVDDLLAGVSKAMPELGVETCVAYGFKQHFKQVTEHLDAILIQDAKEKFGKACEPDTTIATGHSLGGAVSMLIGAKGYAKEVFTFGAPRAFYIDCDATIKGIRGKNALSTAHTEAERQKIWKDLAHTQKCPRITDTFKSFRFVNTIQSYTGCSKTDESCEKEEGDVEYRELWDVVPQVPLVSMDAVHCSTHSFRLLSKSFISNDGDTDDQWNVASIGDNLPDFMFTPRLLYQFTNIGHAHSNVLYADALCESGWIDSSICTDPAMLCAMDKSHEMEGIQVKYVECKERVDGSDACDE